MTQLKVRHYGTHGPKVLLLHGGPGAAGYLSPVAMQLKDSFQVIEPFQQRSRPGKTLTVADHVSDLLDLVNDECPQEPPALVGHSWGAMLALAFAAAHPESAGPLVLIGCGSFDTAARERMNAVRRERLGPDLKERMTRLEATVKDPDKRLAIFGRWMQEADSYDLVIRRQETLEFDAAGHEQTWADMMRLQEEGVYPAAFAAIKGPVVMLYGNYDPHPGEMIFDGLRKYMPQLEYRQWEKCGHYPWLERAARDDFLAVLKAWLTANTSPRSSVSH